MKVLNYEFPLTSVTGKIRIKERFAFSDYGQPIAPTKTIITPKHYLEWQIGYDKVIKTGEKTHFVGANGKNKQIYELSEFLKFGLENSLISFEILKNLKQEIEYNEIFIDEKEEITRSHFIPKTINNIEFLKSKVSYPLLISKFEDDDLLCEIIVREKQRAVGTMPMLYFCISLVNIKDENGNFSFIGRKIKSKEKGYLEINRDNILIFVKIFKIFGLLSRAHQYDCLAILDYILKGNK
ncbi:MAG: R.Pab1 family restriction endonuclease [Campylobacter sputorum]|uniref:R.Pab1 family restriction endonuclease n=1 Tax=Campylobacter sputorum TaxID=206 RepID=UPI000B78166C|nr:R.Pab1 family restriction endonuclease [Campylobacter sputorum]ASM38104.1 type II restriction endonuclease, PabI family [Campylobacter sputorum bv. paraureolyticus LMG 11764]MDY6121252.1 R.Pab1 family restriction endonuclease [Campylobacter sputorum]